MLVGELDAALLTQLPANAPVKAAEDGTGAWAPATHMGDQPGYFGNFELEDRKWKMLLSLCVSLSVCVTLPFR